MGFWGQKQGYNRLHKAYEGVGGNGGAKRRKVHFDALKDEEEYRACNANPGIG